MNTRWRSLLLMSLGVVALAIGVALATAPAAHAQCGSQASSCKNCHEVQGQMPVNDQGEWHVAHAFGDFCEFCHAGNVQATDEAEAHLGMVDPLTDVQASCGSCHPEDLDERAGVYALALGVNLSNGGVSGTGQGPTQSEPSGATDTSGSAAGQGQTVTTSLGATGITIDDPNMVDYVERYKEQVLGIKPINRGNVVLGIMIAFVAIGGGAFVTWNELRRGTKEPEGVGAVERVEQHGRVVGEARTLSPEMEEMLDSLSSLSPAGRRSLKHILANPDQAEELFRFLSKLDLDLVNRVKGLDREARALLLLLTESEIRPRDVV